MHEVVSGHFNITKLAEARIIGVMRLENKKENEK